MLAKNIPLEKAIDTAIKSGTSFLPKCLEEHSLMRKIINVDHLGANTPPIYEMDKDVSYAIVSASGKVRTLCSSYEEIRIPIAPHDISHGFDISTTDIENEMGKLIELIVSYENRVNHKLMLAATAAQPRNTEHKINIDTIDYFSKVIMDDISNGYLMSYRTTQLYAGKKAFKQITSLPEYAVSSPNATHGSLNEHQVYLDSCCNKSEVFIVPFGTNYMGIMPIKNDWSFYGGYENDKIILRAKANFGGLYARLKNITRLKIKEPQK